MIKLPPKVLAQTRVEVAAEQPEVCRAMFDALVRRIDAIDPSYRN